jgi:hypothetical protein
VARVLGDSEGRRMVEDLLQEQKAHVRGLLAANRHLVEALRDALVERHELIGHEITDVLEAAHDAHRLGRPVRIVQASVTTGEPGVIDLRQVTDEALPPVGPGEDA